MATLKQTDTIPPIYYWESAAGVKTFPIPNGVSVVTVTGAAFPTVPTAIMACVLKPNGGLNGFATVDKSTITDDGFVASLNFTTDSANYVLAFVYT